VGKNRPYGTGIEPEESRKQGAEGSGCEKGVGGGIRVLADFHLYEAGSPGRKDRRPVTMGGEKRI